MLLMPLVRISYLHVVGLMSSSLCLRRFFLLWNRVRGLYSSDTSSHTHLPSFLIGTHHCTLQSHLAVRPKERIQQLVIRELVQFSPAASPFPKYIVSAQWHTIYGPRLYSASMMIRLNGSRNESLGPFRFLPSSSP